jgi:hypothetical protein
MALATIGVEGAPVVEQRSCLEVALAALFVTAFWRVLWCL